MNDLDDAIRQSLSAEDAALFNRLGADQALYDQISATFRGRLRWLNLVGWIAGIVLFLVGATLAWRFALAETVPAMLRYGAASALCFAGLTLIKIWFWLELQKNALVGEVKRLELQLAVVASLLRQH
jgi:hypothetical protein